MVARCSRTLLTLPQYYHTTTQDRTDSLTLGNDHLHSSCAYDKDPGGPLSFSPSRSPDRHRQTVQRNS
eukprot:scaffold766_cov167-Ochromonas_danica.AAC.15